MKKFPPVTKDKESGLPKKYVAGLSTSTSKARAAHWKKMGKLSDKDPRAYEPAPGDATAKTKPSKYTKRFHKMFGEQIGIVVEGAPEKIEGTNCGNCTYWVKESEKPVDKSELNEFGGLKAPNEAYVKMSKHADLVTLPGKATVKIKAYCEHKDINDFVTERMCCAYWDGEGVKREFKGTSPMMDESIVKVDNKYRLVSKKTGRNLGTYDTKAGAIKRERQVQYFKSLGETMNSIKEDHHIKVGDRIVTIKGGQNTGTVEKIEGGRVYFRSDYSRPSLGGGTHKPLYKTHMGNVRLHEGFDTDPADIAAYLVDRHGKGKVTMDHIEAYERRRDSHRPIEKHAVMQHVKKLSQKGEQVDEAQKKLKPSYWRAEWRLGTQTEVDKNNKKIYDRLAKTDPGKAKAFHDNLMKMRKEEVEQCAPGQYYCNTDKMCKPIPEGYKVQKDGMLVKAETQREGFLDFFKKKKPVAKKPAFSHAHAKAFFNKLDKQTRITPMRPNAQKVRTVYAEANGDFVAKGVEKEKKAQRERRIRDMRVIHHQNRHVKQASMGAHLGEGAADSSLAAKAKKSGVSLSTLRKVYNRGVAAWNSGHRPGTTPQQWGHARVNSYITKGKTYHTADKDLRRESVDVNEAFSKEFGNEIE